MHCALQISEVLLDIFVNLVSFGFSTEDRRIIGRDLAALARTCRTFKEPALDVLWSELDDPTPLSRCLPDIPRQTVSGLNHAYSPGKFSFTRSLQPAEWDVLRSYTRRVWCIRRSQYDKELDWKFLRDLTPDANPLFPNLRSLHCTFTEEIIPFLCLPFPSLIQLNIYFTVGHRVDPFTIAQDPLQSFVKTSPKIKRLRVQCSIRKHDLSKMISRSICGWSNLQTITCPRALLNVDTLIHLCRIPSLAHLTLAHLTFMLSERFLDSPVPSNSLSLPALKYMELHAESLSSVSRLLLIQLPTITDFIVVVYTRPSKQDLASFMTDVQISGIGNTLQEFNLQQPYDQVGIRAARFLYLPSLDLDDLRSCLAFQNLCRLNIDLDWNVGLSNDQLLTLGLAWPRLQTLSINPNWGWKSRGGITPLGLARLLEMCPSLTSIALAIDTLGFIKAPPGRPREPLDPWSGTFEINVIDSAIEQQSVDAMVALLLDIVPHFCFTLTSSVGCPAAVDCHSYCKRWKDVYTRTNELIVEQSLDLLCQLPFPS